MNKKICDAHVHLGESGPWQPYMNPTIYVDKLMKILLNFVKKYKKNKKKSWQQLISFYILTVSKKKLTIS